MDKVDADTEDDCVLKEVIDEDDVGCTLTVGTAVTDPTDDEDGDQVALKDKLPLGVGHKVGKGEADAADE